MKPSPADRLRNEQQFDAYIKKVLRNHARTLYTAQARQRKRECTLEQAPLQKLAYCDRYTLSGGSFDLHGATILVEDDDLYHALCTLSQEKREIMLSYYFLRMSDREIAQTLQRPRETVKSIRRRTLQQLKYQLEAFQP